MLRKNAANSSRPDSHETLELLTAREVARILRLSLATVRRLSARGGLPPPVRLGRSVRWRKSDVLRALGERA